MKKYFAAMFDIVGSKSYDDAFEIFELVKYNIKLLNKIYEKYLVKNVIVQRGDEYQGLFKNPESAFNYIRQLQLLIFPIRIRAAIGVGTIEGNEWKEEKWESGDVVGAAYYNAGSCLEKLPGNGKDLIFFNSQKDVDQYLNTILMSNRVLKSRQSKICKFLELFIELLYPLNKNMSFYKNESTQIIEDIISLKIALIKKLDNSLNAKSQSSILVENININELTNELINNKDDNIHENKNEKLYIEGNIPFGTSTILSRIVGTSVQNINKHIILSDLKQIRANDELILNIVSKLY